MSDFTRFFLEAYPQMVGLGELPGLEEMPDLARRMHEEGRRTRLHVRSAAHARDGLLWLGMMAPHMLGGTAALLEGRGLDAAELWRDGGPREGQLAGGGGATPSRVPCCAPSTTTPGRWDTSCLKLVVSSGAMFSLEVKQGLIGHLPELAIADVLGSTEGGMGQSIVRAGVTADTAKFKLNPTTKVFDENDREVEPGSGVVGRVANGGLVPIGYYKDPEKSARTFREIDGVRYSFAGDMVTVEADGRITLLGRGSNCINSGGEKIFPEEVEEAAEGARRRGRTPWFSACRTSASANAWWAWPRSHRAPAAGAEGDRHSGPPAPGQLQAAARAAPGRAGAAGAQRQGGLPRPPGRFSRPRIEPRCVS